jgi:hypothetical protein
LSKSLQPWRLDEVFRRAGAADCIVSMDENAASAVPHLPRPTAFNDCRPAPAQPPGYAKFEQRAGAGASIVA